jgi:hypothetical protein
MLSQSRRGKRMIVRAILVTATAAVIAGSTAAIASAGMTMTVGSPTLSSKVLVTVPLTITCSPFDPSLTFFSASAAVSVEQAVGQQIATGFGSVGGFMGGTQLAYNCDNSPQSVPVLVQANSNGPPFHGGPALFRISAGAAAGIPCGFFGCFTDVVFQSASQGPSILNMHG